MDRRTLHGELLVKKSDCFQKPVSPPNYFQSPSATPDVCHTCNTASKHGHLETDASVKILGQCEVTLEAF